MVRNLFVNWGLYIFIVASFFLAGIVTGLLQYYQIPIIPFSPGSLISAKLTFLSIILALGMFQYNYFYNETKEANERVERGDFGPGWSDYVKQAEQVRQLIKSNEQQIAQAQQLVLTSKQNSGLNQTSLTAEQIGALEAAINTEKAKLEQLRAGLITMDKAILSAKADWLKFIRSILLHFSLRISLMFSVGFQVFASLSLDLVSLVKAKVPFDPQLYSQSTFLTSLVVFLVTMCLFTQVVQSQLKYQNSRKNPEG